jgi:dihydrofolate reductase
MNAIFAVNSLDGFAVGNTMPWPHNSTDLKRFKRLTSGQTIIMGRGTWDSDMPKPLPNRRNCVLSETLVDPRCEIHRNIITLLESITDSESAWVIGGTKILWQLRPYIKTIYLTRFSSAHHADVFLDTEKYLNQYALTNTEHEEDHTFNTYKRIK